MASTSRKKEIRAGRLGDLTKVNYVVVMYDGVPVRVVEPYFHDFETTYKERWKGKSLLEVYETEFKVTTPPVAASHEEVEEQPQVEEDASYFLKAIRAGFIRINRERSEPSRTIRQSDRISRLSHRHEPPVIYRHASEMVVQEEGDLIIINKPGTVPIHPSGAYRFNSLLYILAVERPDLGELYTIHRLDRLTSGLVILARSSEGAKQVSDAIQGREGFTARKTYIARVTGKFPKNPDELKEQAGVRFEVEGGQQWIIVCFPINVIDPKKGVHVCDEANGRDSTSRFMFLSYDPSTNTSLIKCEPVTGRTHQLRLHLQLMGFSITNDPNYGPVSGVGDALAKKLRPEEHLHCGHDSFAHLCERALQTSHENESDDGILQRHAEKERLDVATLKAVQALCAGCSQKMHPMRHKEIWLHACRFRVLMREQDKPFMDFRVPLPEWTSPFAFREDLFWDD